MKVAKIIEKSAANGPGLRTVVWFQGCAIGCKGCVNPWSWDPDGKAEELTPSKIMARVPAGVEGITLTGGEPFQQDLLELSTLVQLARARGLSIVAFTGYVFPQLLAILNAARDAHDAGDLAYEPDYEPKLLYGKSDIDMLIAGPYDYRRRQEAQPLLGSDNQQIHFLTDRYSIADLPSIPPIEMHFDLDAGSMVTTGVK